MSISLLAAQFQGVTGCAGGTEDAVTCTGEAKGNSGLVTVEVVATEDEILSIEVIDENETVGIGTAAIEELPDAIVEAQNVEVDGISGATFTSDAIKEAVRQALTSAGFDPDSYGQTAAAEQTDESEGQEAEDESVGDQEINTQIVVVGAGGAGMTAAIEAADAGAEVVIVESQPMVGGNSIRSTGGLNAAKTDYQDENEFAEGAGVEKTLAAAEDQYADNEAISSLAEIVQKQWSEYQENPTGYFDSVELMELDTLIGGKGINDPELVETLAGDSKAAVDWLESIGASLASVSSFGGASVKRIHRPLDEAGKVAAVGSYLIPILEENLESRGIEVLLNTTAEEIMVEDGKVCGIRAAGNDGETIVVNSDAVILATGGFGGNLEMVSQLNPELEGFMTTNAPGAQGQGIKMAEEIGAGTVDMDQIQVHPTVQADTAALITEGLRGDGAILVNAQGERFVDEVGTRDVVSAAEIAQPGSYSWLIMDQAMADASSVIQEYIEKGYTVSGESYETLAQEMGVDADTFAETMNQWNSYVGNQEDPDFGRTSFAAALDTAPYYAVKVTAGIHHTMGGLTINTETQVLDTNGKVIPGLYAAGEVTGGVHGANRLGGNAVSDFVVYGRIAGTSAAAYVAS